VTHRVDNPSAYQARDGGAVSSPDEIRDAVWRIAESNLSGAVLDAGSGDGSWIRRMAARSNLTRLAAVDFLDAGASSVPGVEFARADLARDRLPFEDATFDRVFAIEVLEHLANPRHFVNETARVLKAGGLCFFTTPSNDSLAARLSLLLRGSFPAFYDAQYKNLGHITPIFEFDLRRMAQEAGYANAEFFYTVQGYIPKLRPLGRNVTWQDIWPGLQGKLWSDNLICRLSK
jgi:SAM-dependent methyltransferase